MKKIYKALLAFVAIMTLPLFIIAFLTFQRAGVPKTVIGAPDLAVLDTMIIADGDKTRQSIDGLAVASTEMAKAMKAMLEDRPVSSDVANKAMMQVVADLREEIKVLTTEKKESTMHSEKSVLVSELPSTVASVVTSTVTSTTLETEGTIPVERSDFRIVSLGRSAVTGEYTVFEIAIGQSSRSFSAREVKSGRVGLSRYAGIVARVTLPNNGHMIIDIPHDGDFDLPADTRCVTFSSRNTAFKVRFKK